MLGLFFSAKVKEQYEDRARRMSTLSRSDAIQGYQPVKQNSNPLPEPSRIYERNHIHSRSWNVESEASPSQQQQNDYEYYQMEQFYPMDRQYMPTVSEPQVHLGVRQFQRQAKSCEERNEGRDSKRMPPDRRMTFDEEQAKIRQNTAQHLQPETPVAAACQSLWAAKGHLEELQALGISDPSSASTSFESNTDNSAAAGSAEKAREESADKKRLQYKKTVCLQRSREYEIDPLTIVMWSLANSPAAERNSDGAAQILIDFKHMNM
ncbi:hypothetical protein KIN20_032980 [Parelaphostrongylus tenuis]|uniref:Uncharacterized protein n=1 Tax=Parelaphostrongylus tenuis TaxID=148309 RepID=A0AAD5R7S6_PARTN|nr:hypothetical protein KIN20_032980 [Parelaphostrongylus tenuis]